MNLPRPKCDTLTMSWTERDGPPVSAPRGRGFGTIVMKAMPEGSLDGTVQLDYAPSGLMWRLTWPAANALEQGIVLKNSDPSTRRAPAPGRDPTLRRRSQDGALIAGVGR